MSWEDTLSSVSYTSPSGKVFSFLYEDVSKETDLKTATYTFPGKDGAYIQSLGRAGRRFPIMCIFSGENCMSDADAFEDGLAERGTGELVTPMYGTYKVVPTGTIKRSDSVVSQANQSVVEITFAETLVDEAYPSSDVVDADAVSDSLDSFSEAAANDFSITAIFDRVNTTIKAQNTFTKQLHKIKSCLNSIAEGSQGVYTSFKSELAAAESYVDTIASDGLSLARITLNLLALPSKIRTDFSAKQTGYTGLIDSLLTDYNRTVIGENNQVNQYAVTNMVVTGALASLASGIALCSLSAGDSSTESADTSADSSDNASSGTSKSASSFQSRDEAVSVAENLLTYFDSIKSYQDTWTGKAIFVDAGDAYAKLVSLMQQSVDIIINNSFSLPSRRIVTLDRDRQVIELVYELYGSLDRLDEFIADNKLTADEIQMLPMGREVHYYVEVA